ncbi:zinc-binding domain containing protein [Dermatophagoides farinae]|nr:zinc-binding domain containing protein [Dermatophagoides farinae]
MPQLLNQTSTTIDGYANTVSSSSSYQPMTTVSPTTTISSPTLSSPSPSSSSVYYTPIPKTSLKELYAGLGVYYNSVPWNQSFGMERVWMSEFRRVFSQFFTELWSIQPVDKKPTTHSNIRLHMFVDSAKVRFCCERCSHSWTSMKGRVVFWFNLLQPNFKVGIVAIKLFGQRCDSCNLDNSFEQPMWYPEEVTKVLMNLYNRVGQIFYGFEKTKYERQRRMGKPRTQHNKMLCQACQEGICLNRPGSSNIGGRYNGENHIVVTEIKNEIQQNNHIDDNDDTNDDDENIENNESLKISAELESKETPDDNDDQGSEDSGMNDNGSTTTIDSNDSNTFLSSSSSSTSLSIS